MTAEEGREYDGLPPALPRVEALLPERTVHYLQWSAWSIRKAVVEDVKP